VGLAEADLLQTFLGPEDDDPELPVLPPLFVVWVGWAPDPDPALVDELDLVEVGVEVDDEGAGAGAPPPPVSLARGGPGKVYWRLKKLLPKRPLSLSL
jgi:hypothetical protein